MRAKSHELLLWEGPLPPSRVSMNGASVVLKGLSVLVFERFSDPQSSSALCRKCLPQPHLSKLLFTRGKLRTSQLFLIKRQAQGVIVIYFFI